jgi:MFS superfamily sulfate permease-like transporter
LPLCIGIAVAVGVSPARAVLTGIIGGIVVGFISGSPMQGSGSAAGLVLFLAELLAHGKASYFAKFGEGGVANDSQALPY